MGFLGYQLFSISFAKINNLLKRNELNWDPRIERLVVDFISKKISNEKIQ